MRTYIQFFDASFDGSICVTQLQITFPIKVKVQTIEYYQLLSTGLKIQGRVERV